MGHPTDPRHIRVFISSPGDVAEERQTAIGIIEALNHDPLIHSRFSLDVVAWDSPKTSLPLPASHGPQWSINQTLYPPAQCDIVVVILWSRLGTPLNPASYGVKPDGSRYLSGTEWEFQNAIAAADQVGKPIVLVYRRIEEIVIRPRDPEYREKLEQLERVEMFFEQFFFDQYIERGFKTYEHRDQFEHTLQSDLRAVLNEFVNNSQTTPPLPTPSAKGIQGLPFPGLRPLDIKDADIFFGRTREVDALYRKFKRNRLVVVLGASGSGKSSLVGAGLLPRLIHTRSEKGHPRFWIRFTPGEVGDNPLMALAVQLRDALDRLGIRPREFALALQSNPYPALESVIKVLVEEQGYDEDGIFMFIDQFEELFTLVREPYRAPFISVLVALLDLQKTRIIMTLRANFYHYCLEWPYLAPLMEDSVYSLGIPGPGSLHEMITRPAEKCGLAFEDGLVGRILDDTGKDTGSLALLAYALDELYHACHGKSPLTHTAYETIGGVRGAIAKRAQATLEKLQLPFRDILTEIFPELVEVDANGYSIRRRGYLKLEMLSDEAQILIQELTDARILVQNQDEHTDDSYFELAHEALLESWFDLAEWIELRKDDLRLLRKVRIEAHEWAQNGSSIHDRWPDERLKPVYAMIERLNPDLHPEVREFIRPEASLLVEELHDVETTHLRRSRIGERLAEIGDPRQGVGITANGLPDILWCALDGGSVEIRRQDLPIGQFSCKSFYLSRYPITYRQFQAFIDSGGYQLFYSQRHGRMRPNSQTYQFGNAPRNNVNWFEAVAFCQWLDTKLPDLAVPIDDLDAWEIRLPTEWEWQLAATGGNPAFLYPWGPEWDPNFANVKDSGLNRVIAVGMYPFASWDTHGPLDMVGNMREWCLNEYVNISSLDMTSDRWRTLRGGGFDSRATGINCYTSVMNKGSVSSEAYSFRIVLAQREK